MEISHSTPQVISRVVEKDLCTGCGLCVTECDNTLAIDYNKQGFLVPELIGSCVNSGNCIKVCPFNDKPLKFYENEDKINERLREDENLIISKDKYLGPYIGIYAGHSVSHRMISSSGGIATYILSKLIEEKIVDFVISVKESNKNDVGFYEYSISSTIESVVKSSETKYHPVSMSEVISIVENTDSKYAITGIPCFIKALRLKQAVNSSLKKKIPFMIGIFCGGLKSKFYTDYLISKTNFNNNEINNAKPLYRIKNKDCKSSDYSFGVMNTLDKKISKVRMKTLPDMWGTGLFKCNACDYCDDLCAETADLSIGDAWIEPFVSEGMGDNIIITRSQLADNYIKRGIELGELSLKIISADLAIQSQRGNVNHRRKGLKLRLFVDYILFNFPLKKRVFPSPFHGLSFWLVQIQRRIVRKKSLSLWIKKTNSINYQNELMKDINLLSKLTRVNHFFRRISLKNIYRKFFKVD